MSRDRFRSAAVGVMVNLVKLLVLLLSLRGDARPAAELLIVSSDRRLMRGAAQ